MQRDGRRRRQRQRERGGERILRCVTTMTAECKNRWGMPDYLEGSDITWSNIMKYYSQSTTSTKQE